MTTLTTYALPKTMVLAVCDALGVDLPKVLIYVRQVNVKGRTLHDELHVMPALEFAARMRYAMAHRT